MSESLTEADFSAMADRLMKEAQDHYPYLRDMLIRHFEETKMHPLALIAAIHMTGSVLGVEMMKKDGKPAELSRQFAKMIIELTHEHMIPDQKEIH